MKRASLAVLFLSLVGASVPAFAGPVYSSGPGNDQFDAWTLDFGFSVTDSFTLSQATTLSGATFDVWAIQGDTLSSIDWSIGNSQYGGAVSTAATSGVFDTTNDFGYDIDTESFSIPNVSLAAGTYWLTLQNASVPSGDPIYWDENDGASTGFESSVGSIGDYECSNNGACGLSGGRRSRFRAPLRRLNLPVSSCWAAAWLVLRA